MEILVINFSLEGMTESEYQSGCDDVAPAFAAVPGLVSKVWLADRANGVYGGVYTFENGQGAAVDAYLASDLLAQVAATSRAMWTSRCAGSRCCQRRRRSPRGLATAAA